MDTDNSSRTPSVASPVLILGGSGFIGTRLTTLLIERGVPVGIGDVRPSASFPELWSEADVRKHETLSEAAKSAKTIINLAAEHRDDVRPISRYYETNVQAATEVCIAARKAGIQQIVFTSSVAVYGFQPVPVDEAGPFAPFNAYGKTKLEAERIYRGWAAEDAMRSLVIVRPTVVFGEGNRGNVYSLISQIASGRFFMVGPGTNVKSIAYVGNVAAFLTHVLSLGSGVHTFNYVDGPDLETRDLVHLIKRSLGREGRTPSIPLSIAMAGGHLLDLVARASGRTFPISALRIRKFCESTQFRAERAQRSGFVPPFSLHEGLLRTVVADFCEQLG